MDTLAATNSDIIACGEEGKSAKRTYLTRRSISGHYLTLTMHRTTMGSTGRGVEYAGRIFGRSVGMAGLPSSSIPGLSKTDLASVDALLILRAL